MILDQLSDISPFEEKPEATQSEVAGAAFRQSNVIGSDAYAYRDDRSMNKVFFGDYSALEKQLEMTRMDPDYKFREYMPEEYEPYQGAYARTRTAEEADVLTTTIAKELKDKQILSDNPKMGFIYTAAAALTSPEQFPLYAIPGSVLIKEASLARSFGIAASLGAAEASLSELYLQDAQSTRSAAESMFNIGGSAAFAGTLGLAGNLLFGSAKVMKGTDEAMYADSTPAMSIATPVKDYNGKFSKEHYSAAVSEVDAMVKKGTVKFADRDAMVDSVLTGYAKTANTLKHPKVYKAMGFMSPGVRLMTSGMSEVRDITSKLISSPLQTLNNKYGRATISAEVQIDQLVAEASSRVHLISNEGYTAHRNSGGTLSHTQFMDEVGLAHTQADKGVDDVISKTAKDIRGIINPIEKRMVDANVLRKGYEDWEGLVWDDIKHLVEEGDVKEVYFRKDGLPRAGIVKKLDGNVLDQLVHDLKITAKAEQPVGDLSYYHRRWNQVLLNSNRNEFISDLKSVMQNNLVRKFSKSIESLQEEISIRKAKLAKTKPKTSASTGQRRTPEQMLAQVEARLKTLVEEFQQVKLPEFEAQVGRAADEVYNNIANGNYRARKGYKLQSFETGPLKERIIDIPFQDMSKWLDKDPNSVWYHYLRDAAPRLVMKETFGDEDAGTAITSVLSAFDSQINKAQPKLARKLGKQRKAFKRDVTAMVEQLHNRYAQPANPDSIFSHAGQFLRNHNLLTKLGMMTVSALPDIGHINMRHGARVLKFGPEVFSFSSAAKADRAFMKDIGLAMDLFNSKRLAEMNMLDQNYTPRNKFDKLMTAATTGMGKWTGMNLWNAQLKTMVGTIYAKGVLRDALEVATMAPKKLARYAQGGLSKSDLEKIAKYGKNQSIPEINNWPDKALAARFKQAIFKEAETTIVTPGVGDLPLVSKGEVGRLIFQFKSFAIAANHRMTMATLDDLTMQKMVGLGTALFAGYVSYASRQTIMGKPIATDFDTVVKESVDRSGFLAAWLSVNTLVERASKGNVDAFKAVGLEGSPTTRYQFDGTLGVALGPWLSTVKNANQVVGAISSGQMEERDWRAMRRLVWLNNHFLLHRGFTEIERKMP